MRRKNGFTLMELLVSIFITGMVMLSLVAMWKTSSNHTSQAQRQSIIKNENTIFLRKFYADFISASEVICPWGLGYEYNGCDNNPNVFIAVNNARVTRDSTTGNLQLTRTTGPLCEGAFNDVISASALASKCVTPTFTAYIHRDDGIFKCRDVFLNDTDLTAQSVDLNTFYSMVIDYCNGEGDNRRELILPYVSSFSLTVPTENEVQHTESLLVEYTINRNFSREVPPVFLKFRRYFMKHKGV